LTFYIGLHCSVCTRGRLKEDCAESQGWLNLGQFTPVKNRKLAKIRFDVLKWKWLIISDNSVMKFRQTVRQYCYVAARCSLHTKFFVPQASSDELILLMFCLSADCLLWTYEFTNLSRKTALELVALILAHHLHRHRFY